MDGEPRAVVALLSNTREHVCSGMLCARGWAALGARRRGRGGLGFATLCRFFFDLIV